MKYLMKIFVFLCVTYFPYLMHASHVMQFMNRKLWYINSSSVYVKSV